MYHIHTKSCKYMKSKIFIYLGVLCLSCGMWGLVPQPGIEPGPLHWEQGVLAIGPPGKSPKFLIFKLRQKSHDMKLAILKCPGLWHIVHSQSCTIIASSSKTRWGCHHPKRRPQTTKQSLPIPPHPFGSYQAAFCIYGLICSGYFIWMEASSMWPIVSGLFHWA